MRPQEDFFRRDEDGSQKARLDSPFLNPNGFLDYEQVLEDTFATASTRIPKTWSTGFIHGADSLLPVTRLASRVLRPDEVIRGIERVTWKKPMTSNLQIAVMRGSMAQDASSVMSGSLRTTQGELAFEARLIDEPLNEVRQASNPCATLCTCAKCLTVSRSGLHKFVLSAPSVPNWKRELRDPALLTATMAELVTKAVSSVDLHGRGDDQSFRLMGGLSDLPLPDRPEDIFTGTLKIRVSEKEIHQGRSGVIIAPFVYAFPHQSVVSRGFAALTDDMSVVRRVMGQ